MNLFFRLLRVFLLRAFRPRLHVLDDAVTTFRVWPTDLDVNRHMTNGKYFSVMDVARVDLMVRSGLIGPLRTAGIFPLVASQTLRYRRALAPFARFQVRTRMLGWDERFLYVQQTFERGGEAVASAIVKGIFMRKSGGRVLPAEVLRLAGLSGDERRLPDWVCQWVESEDAAWEHAQEAEVQASPAP